MPDNKDDISLLAEEFKDCQKILLALGDANRQYLILEMMRTKDCGGVRVATLTEKSHLSRPAVSHHLQILKNAGIVKMRRVYSITAWTRGLNLISASAFPPEAPILCPMWQDKGNGTMYFIQTTRSERNI